MRSDGEPSSCSVATSAGPGHGPLPSAFSINGYSIESPNGGRLTIAERTGAEEVDTPERAEETRAPERAEAPAGCAAPTSNPTASRPADREARHQLIGAYDNRAHALPPCPTTPRGTAGLLGSRRPDRGECHRRDEYRQQGHEGQRLLPLRALRLRTADVLRSPRGRARRAPRARRRAVERGPQRARSSESHRVAGRGQARLPHHTPHHLSARRQQRPCSHPGCVPARVRALSQAV